MKNLKKGNDSWIRFENIVNLNETGIKEYNSLHFSGVKCKDELLVHQTTSEGRDRAYVTI